MTVRLMLEGKALIFQRPNYRNPRTMRDENKVAVIAGDEKYRTEVCCKYAVYLCISGFALTFPPRPEEPLHPVRADLLQYPHLRPG